MTKEQLESALDHENVEGFSWMNADEYSFSRECKDKFSKFKEMHDAEVIRIKGNESKLIGSMGM